MADLGSYGHKPPQQKSGPKSSLDWNLTVETGNNPPPLPDRTPESFIPLKEESEG